MGEKIQMMRHMHSTPNLEGASPSGHSRFSQQSPSVKHMRMSTESKAASDGRVSAIDKGNLASSKI